MKSIIYTGWYRTTEVKIDVDENDSLVGYKHINCLECNGTGIWDFVEYIPLDKCVNCKGTGKILINV